MHCAITAWTIDGIHTSVMEDDRLLKPGRLDELLGIWNGRCSYTQSLRSNIFIRIAYCLGIDPDGIKNTICQMLIRQRTFLESRDTKTHGFHSPELISFTWQPTGQSDPQFPQFPLRWLPFSSVLVEHQGILSSAFHVQV